MSAASAARSWFDRLGQPLTAPETQAARAYLQALGYGDSTRVAGVADAEAAESIIRSPGWDERWWTTESTERERLQTLAEARLGRAEVLEHLTQLATRHNDEISAAAQQRVQGDAALARAAAGAAALALHEQALAGLTGAPADHLFMRKYVLFALGRWPLGVVLQTFHLY